MGVSKIKRRVNVDYSRLSEDSDQRRDHVNMVIMSMWGRGKPETVFIN
jgi:hypothetical protein